MRVPPLRLLVVLYFVFAVANLIASFVLPVSSLPEVVGALAALDAHSAAWLDAQSGLEQLAVAGAVLLFLLLHVAGLVGLCLYRRWGRTLSVATTLVAYASLPFTGASIEGAVENLLNILATLTWGSALALAYWSSVAERFAAPSLRDR